MSTKKCPFLCWLYFCLYEPGETRGFPWPISAIYRGSCHCNIRALPGINGHCRFGSMNFPGSAAGKRMRGAALPDRPFALKIRHARSPPRRSPSLHAGYRGGQAPLALASLSSSVRKMKPLPGRRFAPSVLAIRSALPGRWLSSATPRRILQAQWSRMQDILWKQITRQSKNSRTRHRQASKVVAVIINAFITAAKRAAVAQNKGLAGRFY